MNKFESADGAGNISSTFCSGVRTKSSAAFQVTNIALRRSDIFHVLPRRAFK